MSQPIPVDILSDSDSDSGGDRRKNLRNDPIDLTTPSPLPQSKKKQRIEAFSNPSDSTVFIIDDDPTPCKKNPSSSGPTSSTTPAFVAETPFSDASIVKCSRGKCSFSGEGLATEQLIVADTPMSELLKSEVSLTKCNKGVPNSDYASLISNHNSAEINGRICVESDNESENIGGFGAWKFDESVFAAKLTDESEFDARFVESSFSLGTSAQLQKKPPQNSVTIHILEGCSSPGVLEDGISVVGCPNNACDDTDNEASKIDTVGQMLSQHNKSGRYTKEKKKADETMKPKRTSKEERLRLMEEKKQLKEREKLLKAASKAEAAEMKKIASERIEISYVLIIYEAEEFCNLVMNESIMDHVQNVQHRYPHHTICYVTNRLMAYINKREQAQYKNPANYTGWKRPAIEEVLTKLATHYFKVHSRQCVDEAELAEHVVGLTCSLASCQFRKKLTRLSVNANGSVVPKDCTEKNLIKKNLWLKALVAIPKVQPRFAIAIWKKYPTMKSLLRVYMDPTKSVHEKEFLLKDLTTEGLFGDDRRLGEVCSKRIYRILMAQCGNIKTDDVENGADFFQST
ncbi:hypothetical protein DH2020_047843 [Rehmannia glutinosa]|uniref:ERCC4 domain-containing protein n=1 Tax=Rehmannia glutinosa TaxID=99300 RepID=A0ABR0U804_REHGL